ncbi:MAG: GntR family transcriptional regulator [Bacteroidia bacterium]|nr:GntR family transcriptional regulator [Bacteroidia bacterium]
MGEENIIFGQQTTKVQQLADRMSLAISMKEYRDGDSLPSINQLSQQYGVSRDTVFKAFMNLKERELIDSTPGKGYYVTNKLTQVLLLLDEYSPFKETLYNSFVHQLPLTYKVDLVFHQYNERLFNTLIRESAGRYNKYVVMNFSNEQFSSALQRIPQNKLLLLDFGKFDKAGYSYICQDFDENFFEALSQLNQKLVSYRKINFLFPKTLKHPQSSQTSFKSFCQANGYAYEVIEETDQLCVESGEAYIAIKQQDVVKVIKEGRKKRLQCGKDYGLLAYNDIPSYEVIDNGITSLSINWQMMGNKIADFVCNNTPVQLTLPTDIIWRHSL